MEHVNVTKIPINQSGFSSGIYYIKLVRGEDIAIKKTSNSIKAGE
jgi:hypothetical protein